MPIESLMGTTLGSVIIILIFMTLLILCVIFAFSYIVKKLIEFNKVLTKIDDDSKEGIN